MHRESVPKSNILCPYSAQDTVEIRELVIFPAVLTYLYKPALRLHCHTKKHQWCSHPLSLLLYILNKSKHPRNGDYYFPMPPLPTNLICPYQLLTPALGVAKITLTENHPDGIRTKVNVTFVSSLMTTNELRLNSQEVGLPSTEM